MNFGILQKNLVMRYLPESRYVILILDGSKDTKYDNIILMTMVPVIIFTKNIVTASTMYVHWEVQKQKSWQLNGRRT